LQHETELQRTAAGLVLEAERLSVNSHARLESGEVDPAVGYMPSLEAGFHQQTLFRQAFVCLAARRHPRIRRTPTLKTFTKEDHVVISTSGTGHCIVKLHWHARFLGNKGTNVVRDGVAI
jgi:DNA-binding transcriptional LysR family regulator